MVNPAAPAYQLVGVYNLEMARIYNYLLQQTGGTFTIIHSLDGYDEISLTNDTKVITNKGEKLIRRKNWANVWYRLLILVVGKRLKKRQNISKILKGEGSWAQNAVVLANAAMALHSTGSYANV